MDDSLIPPRFSNVFKERTIKTDILVDRYNFLYQDMNDLKKDENYQYELELFINERLKSLAEIEACIQDIKDKDNSNTFDKLHELYREITYNIKCYIDFKQGKLEENDVRISLKENIMNKYFNITKFPQMTNLVVSYRKKKTSNVTSGGSQKNLKSSKSNLITSSPENNLNNEKIILKTDNSVILTDNNLIRSSSVPKNKEISANQIYNKNRNINVIYSKPKVNNVENHNINTTKNNQPQDLRMLTLGINVNNHIKTLSDQNMTTSPNNINKLTLEGGLTDRTRKSGKTNNTVIYQKRKYIGGSRKNLSASVTNTITHTQESLKKEKNIEKPIYSYNKPISTDVERREISPDKNKERNELKELMDKEIELKEKERQLREQDHSPEYFEKMMKDLKSIQVKSNLKYTNRELSFDKPRDKLLPKKDRSDSISNTPKKERSIIKLREKIDSNTSSPNRERTAQSKGKDKKIDKYKLIDNIQDKLEQIKKEKKEVLATAYSKQKKLDLSKLEKDGKETVKNKKGNNYNVYQNNISRLNNNNNNKSDDENNHHSVDSDRLIEEKRSKELKFREEKEKEIKIKEEKIQEQKVIKQKLHEEKVAEHKLKEERAKEERAKEEKAREEKLLEQRLIKQRIEEKRIKEQKEKEEKLVEEKVIKLKAFEERKLNELRIKEEKLAKELKLKLIKEEKDKEEKEIKDKEEKSRREKIREEQKIRELRLKDEKERLKKEKEDQETRDNEDKVRKEKEIQEEREKIRKQKEERELKIKEDKRTKELKKKEVLELEEKLKNEQKEKEEKEARKIQLEKDEEDTIILNKGTINDDKDTIILNKKRLHDEKNNIIINKGTINDEEDTIIHNKKTIHDEKNNIIINKGTINDEEDTNIKKRNSQEYTLEKSDDVIDITRKLLLSDNTDNDIENSSYSRIDNSIIQSPIKILSKNALDSPNILAPKLVTNSSKKSNLKTSPIKGLSINLNKSPNKSPLILNSSHDNMQNPNKSPHILDTSTDNNNDFLYVDTLNLDDSFEKKKNNKKSLLITNENTANLLDDPTFTAKANNLEDALTSNITHNDDYSIGIHEKASNIFVKDSNRAKTVFLGKNTVGISINLSKNRDNSKDMSTNQSNISRSVADKNIIYDDDVNRKTRTSKLSINNLHPSNSNAFFSINSDTNDNKERKKKSLPTTSEIIKNNNSNAVSVVSQDNNGGTIQRSTSGKSKLPTFDQIKNNGSNLIPAALKNNEEIVDRSKSSDATLPSGKNLILKNSESREIIIDSNVSGSPEQNRIPQLVPQIRKSINSKKEIKPLSILDKMKASHNTANAKKDMDSVNSFKNTAPLRKNLNSESKTFSIDNHDQLKETQKENHDQIKQKEIEKENDEKLQNEQDHNGFSISLNPTNSSVEIKKHNALTDSMLSERTSVSKRDDDGDEEEESEDDSDLENDKMSKYRDYLKEINDVAQETGKCVEGMKNFQNIVQNMQ